MKWQEEAGHVNLIGKFKDFDFYSVFSEEPLKAF